MILTSLPPEILSAVTARLHAFDIAALWLSGCLLLQTKLARGGITKLTCRFHSRLRPFKWPSLFSSLEQLSCFCLGAEYNSLPALVTSDHLATLPITLQELSLRHVGSVEALSELVVQNPDCFPVLEKLEIVSTVGTRQKAIHWPQSLTSLKLERKAISSSAFELDMSSLPPRLTELSGAFRELVFPRDKLTGFPKSLLRLELTLMSFFDILPLLPPDLEKLYFGFDPIITDPRYNEDKEQHEQWIQSGIKNLPPGLTSIYLPISAYNIEILRQLPLTITEILHYETAKLTEVEEFEALPPRLVNPTYLLPPVTKAIALHLPKTITSFATPLPLDVIHELNSRRVSRLLVANSKIDTSTFVCPLPLGLESITISHINRIPLSALPSRLTYLEIQEGVMSTSEIQHLPRSLLVLRLGKSDVSQSFGDFQYLPENLELLACTCESHLNTETSLAIPRRLTSLSLVGHGYIPQAWLEGLPETLTNLRLSVTAFAGAFNGAETVWPKKMIALELHVQNQELDTQTMSGLLKTLPKTMINLGIHWYPLHPLFDISAEDRKSLSKRLESLTLCSLQKIKTYY